MQILRSLQRLSNDLRGGAVAIGNFDGVHRGHARIVERVIAHAARLGGPAVVFTFDPHPLALLRPEASHVPLTTLERKTELLGRFAIDLLVVYPTDLALLGLEPAAFFELVVQEKLGARAIVEGPNFHFGRNRTGDVHVLAALCRQAGIELEVVEPLAAERGLEGGLVSSSRIRAFVQSGQITAANRLLTAPYQLRGNVARGAGRGAKLGFPTANLEQVATVLPAAGVYAARAWVDESPYAAAVSVGPNPTFGDARHKIEVHLIDFAGDLYEHPLAVDFLERLRDIESFGSTEALVAQLGRDVAQARKINDGGNDQCSMTNVQ
jgi:riboflavin kinase / FMN adenylyltransferase